MVISPPSKCKIYNGNQSFCEDAYIPDDGGGFYLCSYVASKDRCVTGDLEQALRKTTARQGCEQDMAFDALNRVGMEAHRLPWLRPDPS